MSRLVQLCVILYCLVKLTLAFLSCTKNNGISICTYSRQQGVSVSVNFDLVPLHDNNLSCSCFLFAQSDTEILATYETFSDSDIILVNTSIRLGDQTFEEATKGFIQLSANSFKKLHFNGDIGASSPRVCLKFNSLMMNIEVVCLPNKNTTVPISVFSTTTNITTKTALETTTQPTSGTTTRPTSETTTRPTFETTTRPTSVITTQPTSETIRQPTSRTTTESTSSITEQSTPSSTEQSSSSTAEVSQHERKPRRINYIVIGGAAGGGFLVVAIVVVVVVIMCRRRRLSVSQNKEQNINMSVNQTEEHTYNVENELYVSADDDILASGNHTYDVTHLQGFDVNHDKAKTTHDVTNNLTDSGSTYDQPDQYNPKNVEKMKRCSNEYSVVFKNKNSTPSVDDTDTYDHVDRV